jgi:hypothetical protein
MDPNGLIYAETNNYQTNVYYPHAKVLPSLNLQREVCWRARKRDLKN